MQFVDIYHTTEQKEGAKMSEYGPELAGICGLFCGTCPQFPDHCAGCLSDQVAPECADCRHGFRICAAEKEAERCCDCGDFPCARLEAFIPIHVENDIVHHEHVIEDLRLMRENGVQAWVDGQARDHTCGQCGKLVPWMESRTHSCADRK